MEIVVGGSIIIPIDISTLATIISITINGTNNKNPILLLIPCHRVIGANGKLIGFAAGLEMKKYLLTLEGISYEC